MRPTVAVHHSVNMARLLVLSVLLCAVAAQIGVHAAVVQDGPWCTMNELVCGDRKECYRAVRRCDGKRDCRDGSDELGCDGIPSAALPVNATVLVQAQYTKHFSYSDDNSVELLLCGTDSCNRVAVFGHYLDGRLGTSTWTGCNLSGKECARQESGSHGYVYDLPSGEVAVEVQRRASELAVWRQGHPEDVVTVPIEENFGKLTVRLFQMWNNMPVQFTGASCGAAGQLECSSGQCVDAAAFCNAVADCEDGSDEGADTCEAVLATTTQAPTTPEPTTTTAGPTSPEPTFAPSD
ncbi:SCO-spondin-like [Thrips palmi]|uniref:SCO-spondin-like n=1 Tax=Thrips palmi TaxID=161013 RepID=A0A6P9AMB4_THRPL|nr:SCO-spondin-like [Thrips palmi]